MESFLKLNKDGSLRVKEATKKGYAVVEVGGVFNCERWTGKTRRGRVIENGRICPTLKTKNEIYVYVSNNLKK